MFLATASAPKRLLHINFIGHVTAKEVDAGLPDVAALLAALPADCRVLADLGRLDDMDLDCANAIGKVMELCDAKGVSLVVRFVPDPTKNIGLNILTLFHYRRRPRIITAATLAEVIAALEL